MGSQHSSSSSRHHKNYSHLAEHNGSIIGAALTAIAFMVGMVTNKMGVAMVAHLVVHLVSRMEGQEVRVQKGSSHQYPQRHVKLGIPICLQECPCQCQILKITTSTTINSKMP